MTRAQWEEHTRQYALELEAKLDSTRALLEQRDSEYRTLTDDFHGVTARLSTVEWRLARIRTLVDGTERPTTEEGIRWAWEQLRTYLSEQPAGLVVTREQLRGALFSILEEEEHADYLTARILDHLETHR